MPSWLHTDVNAATMVAAAHTNGLSVDDPVDLSAGRCAPSQQQWLASRLQLAWQQRQQWQRWRRQSTIGGNWSDAHCKRDVNLGHQPQQLGGGKPVVGQTLLRGRPNNQLLGGIRRACESGKGPFLDRSHWLIASIFLIELYERG